MPLVCELGRTGEQKMPAECGLDVFFFVPTNFQRSKSSSLYFVKRVRGREGAFPCFFHQSRVLLLQTAQFPVCWTWWCEPCERRRRERRKVEGYAGRQEKTRTTDDAARRREQTRRHEDDPEPSNNFCLSVEKGRKTTWVDSLPCSLSSIPINSTQTSRTDFSSKVELIRK